MHFAYLGSSIFLSRNGSGVLCFFFFFFLLNVDVPFTMSLLMYEG